MNQSPQILRLSRVLAEPSYGTIGPWTATFVPISLVMFSTQSLGLYLATDGAKKYVYSAADEKEWGFRIADAAQEERISTDDPEVQALRRCLHDRLRSSSQAEVLSGDDWRRYGRAAIPADPRAGLLFQEDEAVYAAIDRLEGYGPARRQPGPSLFDLTVAASLDPRTGRSPLTQA